MKIEIKSIFGAVLFEYDVENNSIRKALVEAVSKKADLQGADLQGADLQGAYLQGAYLRGADLRGAYLRGAYLRGADLRGAYLRGAYLRGADLQGAYLRGAYLRGADLRGHKIKSAQVFTGLYKYVTIPFITEEGEKRICLGCYNRSLKEWEADFWNNTSEFPNDGNYESVSRVFAFETAKKWLELEEARLTQVVTTFLDI